MATGIANEEGGRFTAHCFRHFFSDTLKKNGIDSYWWNVLRGDVPRGNEATYVHPKPEDIRATYMRYRPMLDVLLPGPNRSRIPGATRTPTDTES